MLQTGNFCYLKYVKLIYNNIVESWRVLDLPYLSGCKARDPVPEILARNSLLMKSLLLPNNKLQNMTNHELQLMMITRLANIMRMYVYVPVLKKLILVSVAWVTSQYFYSPIDGMLDLHKINPSPKLQVPMHLYTWVEGGTVRVIRSVLAKNTTQ